MAYSYVWPTSLPRAPHVDGYSETGGPSVLRSPMDQGPAKQRRRCAKPPQLECVFRMTSAQVETFEGFVNDTLLGTARFGIFHPRKKAERVEVRIVPGEDGLYDIGFVSAGYWDVSVILEVMP